MTHNIETDDYDGDDRRDGSRRLIWWVMTISVGGLAMVFWFVIQNMQRTIGTNTAAISAHSERFAALEGRVSNTEENARETKAYLKEQFTNINSKLDEFNNTVVSFLRDGDTRHNKWDERHYSR